MAERPKLFIISTLGIDANTAVPVLVDRSGVLSGKTVISLVPGNTHTLALAASPPPPSNNADLASLGVTGVTLSPAFASGTLEYTAVPNATTSIVFMT